MDKLIFTSPTGSEISYRMFGAKLERENGPDNPDRYNRAFEYLGIESVRFSYNAGVGEHATYDKKISTSDALIYTAERRMPVTLCIDTEGLLKSDTDNNPFTPREVNLEGIEKVEKFLRKSLSNDFWQQSLALAPIIDTIEIGNEYWGLGAMTSKEYGKLTNVLAKSIQTVISALGEDASSSPKILVQMGSPYSIEFRAESVSSPYFGLSWSEALAQSNLDIISQIKDNSARQAIGGLVEHYYYNQPIDSFSFDSTSLRFIDQDWKIWAERGFSDRDIYVTEWNNKLNNPSQFGLKGAGLILEMFENMVRIGVDGAHIWPFQHNATRLLDTLELDQFDLPKITPRGAVFKLMSEILPGMKLMKSNINTAAGFDYELNSYTNGEEYAIFVTSRVARTQTIKLDVSNMVAARQSVEGVKVGYDPSTADGKYFDGPFMRAVPGYQDPDALATVTALGNIGFANDLKIQLGAFEIVRLTFKMPESLVQMGTERSETLKGSSGIDSLYGNSGHDQIYGDSANDFLHGGTGRDTVNGGTGNDLIIGGTGRDRIAGGPGNDRVKGGSGEDRMSGDGGNDTIAGGSGNDRIYGGTGDDLIKGELGEEKMFGDSGNDTLLGGSGNDRIYGGVGDDLVKGELGDDRLDGDAGRDRFMGGAGRDVFIFDDLADVGHANNADRVLDFRHGADKIDLSELLTSEARFIGSAQFSQVEGQIRYVRDRGLLACDTDGDGKSDWEVLLTNKAILTANDLIL